MGVLIERDHFDDAEYARFGERLAECIPALAKTIALPTFGEGPTTIGAELELFLVDKLGQPMPHNLEVLELCKDQRLTIEITRFNLELNVTPTLLEGRPFQALAADMADTLTCVSARAEQLGARIVTIGILPTLRPEHLGRSALTPLPRYRALSNGIRRARGGAPVRIALAGEDTLNLEWDDVTLEGANTSLQFHLRVRPSEFADTYNAAQLATGPALAMAANSPIFLGRRLWDETRVVLFRQATDDRGELPNDWSPPARVSFGRGWCRKGAVELFAEAATLFSPIIPLVSDESPTQMVQQGRVPTLSELQLHTGTTYYWNRPVYDPHGEGHLRIEFRALPAGPSTIDMMANGAFILGLTLGLAPEIEKYLPGMPFMFARENFHRAARDGVEATLLWPSSTSPSPREIKIVDLLPRLLDLAATGLERGGVKRDEFEPLLDVIRGRAAARMTGARWQRRALAEHEQNRRLPRADALACVLERYMELSQGGRPVHEWPTT